MLAALLLLVAGGTAEPARDARRETPRIPIVLFDLVCEAPPPDEAPDANWLTRSLTEALIEALKARGYDPMRFNPESPSIIRAVDRERILTLEDTAHPEREASARKIAAAYGARYVLFPKLMELTLDLPGAQARLRLGLRVIPDIGATREVTGDGMAQLKPEKRAKKLAERILAQAGQAAAEELVQSLSAMASGGPGSATAPREAETYYAQAMQSLKENRLELVIPLLERATLLDPQNAKYAVALGESYQQKGQMANALMEFRRAVTIEPGNIRHRVRVAKILLERKLEREALSELRRAVTLAPEDEEARAALLEAYQRSGMVEEALEEARRMVQARPKDAGLRVTLGDLLARQGAGDDAIREYQEAVTLDPESPVPHERLAALYRKRDQHAEALKELLLAQRTPAGADDAARYRVIAHALDEEAQVLLAEAAKTAEAARSGTLIREEAYTAVKTLVARADALAAEMSQLKAPGAVKDSHHRRTFAYSLLAQCLFAYQGFYESGRATEGTNAEALRAQAGRELERARETLGTP
ncbi:MAG: tetratricopeptide repeat protein [Armatimonadetes bacterium]|nr:tetratricopeptide repeat protein [Armatimonadota bacterium]